MPAELVLYDAPFSTNAERVAIALGLKGLTAQRVTVPFDDRTRIVELSGQPLVPVLVHDGEVIADSTAIVEHLERAFPEPRLFPADRARAQEVRFFVDWFNRVWKVPPNRIADTRVAGTEDPERTATDVARLRAWLDDFEALLDGRDFLFGDVPTAADLSAAPFLAYARGRAPEDDHPFHIACVEAYPADPQRHPRLIAWLERMAALPRG